MQQGYQMLGGKGFQQSDLMVIYQSDNRALSSNPCMIVRELATLKN